MNVAIAAVIAGVLGTGGEIMPLLGFMTYPASRSSPMLGRFLLYMTTSKIGRPYACKTTLACG